MLQRRATLPYEVPFNVLARLIHSSLSAKDAEEFLLSLKMYNFTLVQGKHELEPPPMSLRFEQPLTKRSQLKREE